jgi:L,D-transpeptidase YcbB
MTRPILHLVSSLLALALAATAANSEIIKIKRKPNFFERLFKVDPNAPRHRRPNMFDRNFGDDVNFIYGGDDQTYYGDPEPLPMIGMGNLAYNQPREVPLFESGALKLAADEGLPSEIRQNFLNRLQAVRVEEKDRVAIFNHYAATGFKSLWIENDRPSERAQKLLAVLASAADDGLQPENYLPAGMAGFDLSKTVLEADLVAQAQFELGLTAASVKYARHISGGQFDPLRLSLYYDVITPTIDAKTALQVLAYSPFPDQYLVSLAPRLPQYAILKAELKRLATQKPEANKLVDTGVRVKKGERDARMPLLREMLLELKLLDAGAALVAEADRDLLDADLSAALKAFQRREKIKVTGALDKASLNKLGVDKTAEHRAAVITNLERARWLPKDLGKRHVFVNQAAFEARVMDGGQLIWKTKVIVGRPMTQTNSFSDEFETVVFNPSWGVPQSILVNEYLPKLRDDPGHFDAIGYKVTDPQGNVVRSSSVDWFAYGNQIPYGVQQPPGGDNALGELKFLFPNKHAIYMHDTPSRKLFAKSERAFSHGCVRVENPRRFAQIILGWSEDKIAGMIESGKSATTPVKNPTKVHLAYLTAWPDEDGKVQYYSDIYERDATMNKALAQTGKQPANRRAVVIVQTEIEPSGQLPE